MNSPPLHSRESSISGQGEAAMIESRTLDVQVARSKVITSPGQPTVPLPKQKTVKFGVAVFPMGPGGHVPYPKTPLPGASPGEGDDVPPDMTSTPVDERRMEFPVTQHQNASYHEHKGALNQSKAPWKPQQDSRLGAPRGVSSYQQKVHVPGTAQPTVNKHTSPSRQIKAPSYVRTGLRQPAAYRNPVRVNTTKTNPRTESQPSYSQGRVQADVYNNKEYDAQGRVQADVYNNKDAASNGEAVTNGYPYGSEGPPGYKEVNNNQPRSGFYANEAPSQQPAIPARSANTQVRGLPLVTLVTSNASGFFGE